MFITLNISIARPAASATANRHFPIFGKRDANPYDENDMFYHRLLKMTVGTAQQSTDSSMGGTGGSFDSSFDDSGGFGSSFQSLIM